MKVLKPLLTAFCISAIFACDYVDEREIKINNKGTAPVFGLVAENDQMKSSISYSDYSASTQPGRGDSSHVFVEIPSSVSGDCSGRPRSWDALAEQSKDKKIRLFIIEVDSVKKYGWDKVFQKNIFNKKYYLTLDELEKTDWKVNYDGL